MDKFYSGFVMLLAVILVVESLLMALHVIPLGLIGIGIIAIFVVLHLHVTQGVRRAGTFGGLVLLFAFGAEFVGVTYGLPFGSYAYSEVAGLKVLELVPLTIFFGWLIILYLAFSTTNLIFQKAVAVLAVSDAVVATAWDLMLDPIAVRLGVWVWIGESPYFGVPLSNFGAWLVISFVVCFLFRYVARPVPSPAGSTLPAVLWRFSPAIMYLLLYVRYAVIAAVAGLPELILIGAVTMLPISGIAMARTLRGNVAPR